MQILRGCLIAGAGGAAGTVLRYLMFLIPLGHPPGFPATTLLINAAGAFFIGLFAAAAERAVNFDPMLVLFFQTGLCGGFTTFSAFSLESFNLLRSGRYMTAFIYIILSVTLCLAAAAAAYALAFGFGFGEQNKTPGSFYFTAPRFAFYYLFCFGFSFGSRGGRFLFADTEYEV